MKKCINTIFIVFVLALMMIIPGNNVQAKAITSLEATESNGEISVKGTAETGTLAVAIMVYDSTETNLVTMQTTAVKSDNTYSDTIAVDSGTYVIKVADYDGGEYITKTVSPNTNTDTDTMTEEEKNEPTNTTTPEEKKESETTDTETNDDVTNPKTGDNIIVFGIIFVIALTGIGVTLIINKKRAKNSK